MYVRAQIVYSFRNSNWGSTLQNPLFCKTNFIFRQPGDWYVYSQAYLDLD